MLRRTIPGNWLTGKIYWPHFQTASHSILKQKILDAGCGPAGIFMAFPDNEVTAFDPLIDQYEADLPHFKRTLYPNVRFVTAQIENFDDGEKYDTIFCMNAINHVADIRKSYGNLARLLQPNGKLVVSIDAHNHGFFKYLFRILPGDILHPCQYDLKDYTRFLEENGLTVIKTEKLKSAFFFDYYVQVAEKN
jgi:2-polyprenyl-3-methyl-5-hydroxy-6-metoxy-1,4-benzoquinol methylase